MPDVKAWLPEWHSAFLEHEWAQVALGVLILVAAGLAANFVVKRLLLRGLEFAIKGTSFARDAELRRHGVIPRLANVIPALVISYGLSHFPSIPDFASDVIQNVANAFIILTLALALSGVLSIGDTIYARRPDSKSRPIKSFVQGLKIVVFIVAALLVVAELADKSIAVLLSGVGAMAAVLMLVFRDSILSFMAGIQISFSDTIRVGDWLSVPSEGADGDVIEISLHFVKIQNWDKTISVIPIQKLVNGSFKNWRGMTESGGRRIMRSISLDQNTVRFLSEKEIGDLKEVSILRPYLEAKELEVANWNKGLGAGGKNPMNGRKLTNIGTFRAYMNEYLKSHASLRKDMTLMVRQLAPSQTGVPIEVYCFTNTTAWAEYEDIQADIFDHVMAILPHFGLSAFQDVGGNDLNKVAAK